jgi:hypothetical protein
VPLCVIEQACEFIDHDRLDLLEQLGKLTSAHSISLQTQKIKDFNRFTWILNPYEHRKIVQEGLKILSLESATILHKMIELGNLPDYVSEYIDLNAVDAIALLSEE